MNLDILQQVILGNTIYAYLVCVSIFIILVVVINAFERILLKRFEKWVKMTSTIIDDFFVDTLKKKVIPIIYVAAFYLSTKGLVLHPVIDKAINIIAIVIFTVFGVRILISFLIFSLETYWLNRERDPDRAQAIKGIITVVRVVVWGLAIIILFDNLGIKISTLVAGLGIGGVAIALAAQAILGDLFSYFTIFFDRPFEIGDFIFVGEYMGVVEHIGIKTTRIRSLGGEELIFSNTDLTNSRVRNYKRMEKRRVVFKIGVTYQTGLEKLKEIPVIITDIIKSVGDTEFDRAHFASYGDFSLNYEIVYYVLGRDYNQYMDIQQEINFKINEEFKKRNIEFAYPTQTLFLEK
jgi:small-conductance mechanosensitive channel